MSRKTSLSLLVGYETTTCYCKSYSGKARILILDEPINALDPEGIREMRTLFQRLNQEDGTTILYPATFYPKWIFLLIRLELFNTENS